MTVVLSIHDVAPATMREVRQLLELAHRHGAIASLLVVPGPWRPPTMSDAPWFVAALHELVERGHEVVVHGWEHRAIDDPQRSIGGWERRTGRLLTRGCGEFAELSRAEAAARIGSGLDAMHAAGLRPVGFTPPGWLASPETDLELAAAGYRYTTSRTAVVDLVTGERHAVPAWSQRVGSPLAGPTASVVERLVLRRLRAGVDVRIPLHPADVTVPSIAASIERMLAAVPPGASRTYGQLVAARAERRAA